MAGTLEVNLQKARVQLVLLQPFFASIALRRPLTIVEDDEHYTGSINLHGEIRLGRKFCEKLTVMQLAGLLAHEAMHHAMLHGFRRGWRNHRRFNIACDKVINDILKESGMELPPNGIFMDGARNFAAEQLYDEDEKTRGDSPTNPGGDEYFPGHGWDDIDESEVPENVKQAIQEIKQELAQAAQAAKVTGTLPGGLEDIIDKIINPPTPWHILLDRWMTGFINANLTWSKPRRQMLDVAYFPSQSKKPSMGVLGLIIDTSGSIGADERDHFWGHVNSMMEKCAPEKIYVLHVDSMVQKVEEFVPDDLPIQSHALKGGGGTDMGEGIKWFQEQDIDLDAVVVLTDGFTPWPKKAPYFPLAILVTTDQKVPYGERIQYEITD